MRRTALTAIALTLAAVPFAAAETKDYSVDTFDTLTIKGAMIATFEQSETRSVTVTQADGDFSDVIIEQEGDLLKIERKSLNNQKKGWGWNKNLSVDKRDNGDVIIKVNGKRVPTYYVAITGPDVTEVNVAQSSDLEASGIDQNDFEGNTSSSADLILSGRANTLRLNASSSSDIEAQTMIAADMSIDASSSADVYGKSRGGDVRIEASSSSDVELETEEGGTFKIDASSSADVNLSGTCTDIDIEASSSADVEADQLICNAARIQASSGADVSAHAADTLYARASSGADISVDGSPQSLDLKDSSGGDISVG